MYVRTKKGELGIVKKVFNIGEYIMDTNPDEIQYDYKCYSYDLIDLIEVGDLLINEYSCRKEPYIEYVSELSVLECFREYIKDGTIKLRGIITKEQLEGIGYKVKEKEE